MYCLTWLLLLAFPLLLLQPHSIFCVNRPSQLIPRDNASMERALKSHHISLQCFIQSVSCSYAVALLTFTLSWRSHIEPSGIGALHLCSTGLNFPANVMYLDFISAESSLFSTSSSTSWGTQNWCCDVCLKKHVLLHHVDIAFIHKVHFLHDCNWSQWLFQPVKLWFPDISWLYIVILYHDAKQ